MLTKVFKSGNSMALRVPKELSPQPGLVSIRAEGDRWVVEPVRPKKWPVGFFKKIQIRNSHFKRPEQGEVRNVDL